MSTIQRALNTTAPQQAGPPKTSQPVEQGVASTRAADTVTLSGAVSGHDADMVRLRSLAARAQVSTASASAPVASSIDAKQMKAFRGYMDEAHKQYDEMKADPEGMGAEENCLGASWEDFKKAESRIAADPALAPFRALSSEELFAITDYTDGGYHMVNRVLRSPGKAVEDDPYQPDLTAALAKTEGALITSALGKLPAYQGEVLRGEVYETEAMAEGAEARVEKKFNATAIGSTYKDLGIMSTTRGAESGYPDKSLLVYHIQTRSGVRIDQISSREDEQEVLVRPGTSFEVVRKEITATDNPMIEGGRQFNIWLAEK